MPSLALDESGENNQSRMIALFQLLSAMLFSATDVTEDAVLTSVSDRLGGRVRHASSLWRCGIVCKESEGDV